MPTPDVRGLAPWHRAEQLKTPQSQLHHGAEKGRELARTNSIFASTHLHLVSVTLSRDVLPTSHRPLRISVTYVKLSGIAGQSPSLARRRRPQPGTHPFRQAGSHPILAPNVSVPIKSIISASQLHPATRPRHQAIPTHPFPPRRQCLAVGRRGRRVMA
jgi:hypothetical protein